jgi:hypothetical protein
LPIEHPKPAYDPASKHQAINLMDGQPVSVANLHPPVRTVAGDLEKVARKAMRKAAPKAPAKAARKALANAAAKPTAPKAMKTAAAKPAKPAPANGALSPEQARLLIALVNCKALAGKPLNDRARIWIRYKCIFAASTRRETCADSTGSTCSLICLAACCLSHNGDE